MEELVPLSCAFALACADRAALGERMDFSQADMLDLQGVVTSSPAPPPPPPQTLGPVGACDQRAFIGAQYWSRDKASRATPRCLASLQSTVQPCVAETLKPRRHVHIQHISFDCYMMCHP